MRGLSTWYGILSVQDRGPALPAWWCKPRSSYQHGISIYEGLFSKSVRQHCGPPTAYASSSLMVGLRLVTEVSTKEVPSC